MENDLKELIESTLNIPCYLEGDSITYPSATVSVYLESAGLVGDGRKVSQINNIQIDLWFTDRSARDEASETLEPVIAEYSDSVPSVERYFDTVAKKFRATIKTEKIK